MKIGNMQKLIISCTVAPSSLYPNISNNPQTPDDAVDQAILAWKAGASIVHIHGKRPFGADEYGHIIRTLRNKTDAIIQIGQSVLSITDRMSMISQKPDMISVSLNNHDIAFPGRTVVALHTREEMEEYCRVCEKFGIKPEWEIAHAGSTWNLKYLAEKGLIRPPYFASLLFDWPGSNWSPAIPEELLYRLGHQIEGTISSVVVLGRAQMEISLMSMALGCHLRVGTEDNPYYLPDQPAKNSEELVARIVRIANEIGRPVAKSSEAREILGIAGT